MIIAYSVLFVNLFFCIGARKPLPAGGRRAVCISKNKPHLIGGKYLLLAGLPSHYSPIPANTAGSS